MALYKVIFSSPVVMSCLLCTRTAAVTLLNITPDGVAVRGYDPVAHFIEKNPVNMSVMSLEGGMT